MTVRIEIEPDAEAELLVLDAWWLTNRTASAHRVLDEVERLKKLLLANPELGVRHKRRGRKSVRWLRLAGTPYKLYYHFARGSDVVTVVSAWSGVRGHGPPLGSR